MELVLGQPGLLRETVSRKGREGEGEMERESGREGGEGGRETCVGGRIKGLSRAGVEVVEVRLETGLRWSW